MAKNAITIIFAALTLISCTGRGGSKTASSGNNTNAANGKVVAVPEERPSQAPDVKPVAADPIEYGYKVVNVYPHSTDSYTQGLFWHDGYLYEGTGLHGKSEIKQVELKTGRALRSASLEKKYFGEGIALHGNMIYQLTWEAGKAFVYDLNNFRVVKSFSYDGEGWGITSDGLQLYMSNGTDKITVRDPETFAVLRTMNVTYKGRPVQDLNELEWIEGEIWANRYLTSQVVKIDPQTGFVTGTIDFAGILPMEDMTRQTDVFNGIAYDAATRNIYVTGKNWNKLFHVEVFEKP